MAASVATREFLLGGEDVPASGSGGEGAENTSSTASSGMAYLSVLLPPMCLNRYIIILCIVCACVHIFCTLVENFLASGYP